MGSPYVVVTWAEASHDDYRSSSDGAWAEVSHGDPRSGTTATWARVSHINRRYGNGDMVDNGLDCGLSR